MKNENNRVATNREIEALLASKTDNLTASEIELLTSYSGYGGTKGSGITDSRILYEYYTPDQLIEVMWGMAYHYARAPFKSICEPACGIGKFFRYAPKEDCTLFGYDISEPACQIARILYPSTAKRKVNILNQSFEQLFFIGNKSAHHSVKEFSRQGKAPFDLIIGNPPYGKFEGKYAGMGEKKYTHAESYDEYFITRGLDMLQPGGLLVLVIGAALENGGTLFIDRPVSKVKQEIAHKGTLIDGYRWPQDIFTGTGVSTEVVVFQRN